ncbi:hypothetical protein ABT104_16270 [Streptomyces mobaraensis]|uniref:hypothetical protein n=1 Tax=Streptomyces mobaraensis TaxID=35621 RepID=UPI00331DE807
MTVTVGKERLPRTGDRGTARSTAQSTARHPARPAPAARVRRLVRRRYGSALLARVHLLRLSVLLLTGALVTLLTVAGLGLSGTWDTVGGRDAPRTVSAADLNLALDDMDAQAANILLSSGKGGRGKADVPYEKAVRLFGEARRDAGRELRALSVAVEGDADAERTVSSLIEDFARYEELVGRALEEDARPDGKPAAVGRYRTATDLVADALLPRARSLVDTTDRAFRDEYDAARTRLWIWLTASAVLCAALLGALGALQLCLARAFRRVVNPALAGATLCALLALVAGSLLCASSADRLRVARHDAFDSVVALSRARALAYDINADESRYLLDRDRRDRYQRSFLEKSRRLYDTGSLDLPGYRTALAETWRDHRDGRGDHFTGEFRHELDNITFAGEGAAAERTVDAYVAYQRDDGTIRSLVAQGREAEAVAFGISWDEGKSNAHFGAWTDALGETIGINRAAFDGAVRQGRDDIAVLLPAAVGALLLAGALTFAGLRPRLAEFR